MTTQQRGRAVIAGASGFVGRAIANALRAEGWEVTPVGRRERITWADADALRDAVSGAAMLVNLAGTSVNRRYTDGNRDEILRSRLSTTRALHAAVSAASVPPPLWLNASTATIYRHETERANTEESGVLGEGFSVDVARAWEEEFFAGSLPATRRAALRMAIVLGDGDATRLLLRLARTGLGGPQIDGWMPPHRRYRGIGPHPTGPDRAPWHRTRGRQRFSWVHIDDVVSAVTFIRDHAALSGPVNIAAPHPSDNRELMRMLREVTGARVGLPAWRWMLEPAMWALRTEPELVLKSRWVVPEKLTSAGYVFAHPHLEPALREIVAAPGRA